jgi:dihydrofolate synthase/folylpolyglutamate synthase
MQKFNLKIKARAINFIYMDYHDSIAYLESLSNFGINPSLSVIRKLCQGLKNPESNFPAIQVTGTNGKTSTARFISSILESQELKVGTYLSPHLSSFNQRFLLNGKEISNQDFSEVMTEVFKIVEQLKESEEIKQATQFECLTAVAFQWFAKKQVEVAVLEVGMGSRWDATSVAKAKVGVLTNVALDHANYLGPSLEAIAKEKAYTIPKGGKAVIGKIGDKEKQIFLNRAKKAGAKLAFLNKNFSVIESRDGLFSVKGLYKNYNSLKLTVLGSFQKLNVALAIAAAESFLGRKLEEKKLKAALESVSLPGRLEVISKNPYLIIDGAHNLAGIKVLRKELLRLVKDNKIILVLSILKDKEVNKMLEAIIPLAKKVIATSSKNPRSLTAKTLSEMIRNSRAGVDCLVKPNLAQALRSASNLASDNDIICITGSLYLVGEARNLLTQGDILNFACSTLY